MDTYWINLRRIIRESKEQLSISYGYAAIPGTYTMEVLHRDLPMPICIVWFRFSGNAAIEIYHSFTFEYLRRCGLRTFVHQQMRKHYPTRTILSCNGTKSGLAWMKATGYKHTEAGWEFKPKQSKQSK